MDRQIVVDAVSVTDSLDRVIHELTTGRQHHRALSHANLLLTQLLIFLRPVPNRQAQAERAVLQVPGETDELGFSLLRVRELSNRLFAGIAEIEHGQFDEARSTFSEAKAFWGRSGGELQDTVLSEEDE